MSVVANSGHARGDRPAVMGLFSMPRTVETVRPSDWDTLEEIHAASFVAPWSADEQAALNDAPGVTTFVARRSSAAASRRPIGFITVRCVEGEAEVLTMAVLPRQRRGGIGRKLLDAALRYLYAERACEVFLEVDPDNVAALALYGRAGFVTVGERPNYYPTGAGAHRKALTMRLTLDQPLFGRDRARSGERAGGGAG